MARIEELYNGVLKGSRQAVDEAVKSALERGVDVKEILEESMIPAMREIGERFARREAFVPEMLIAARAMQGGLDTINPLLAESGRKAPAKVCIGTVKGDLHDIGKNLVAIMLKGAGFDVVDLGIDCDAEKFRRAVDDGARVVLCSALLTTTMPYMKEVVDSFAGKSDVKVILGGAPVTEAYSRELGADGYGENANDAVHVVETCLGLI